MPRYTVVKRDDTIESGGFGVPGKCSISRLKSQINSKLSNRSNKGLLEALVADLDPQQKYNFRVKALTKSTEGAWTDEISVTTSSRLLPDEPRSSSTKGKILGYSLKIVCVCVSFTQEFTLKSTFCTFIANSGPGYARLSAALEHVRYFGFIAFYLYFLYVSIFFGSIVCLE